MFAKKLSVAKRRGEVCMLALAGGGQRGKVQGELGKVSPEEARRRHLED
jgi:hypothetical protein